jgi:hypothetical protein
MPRYLYSYFELFGYVGAGTPEDPGSDFGMSVWIDAANEEEAKQWGRLVLHDYVRARFKHSEDHVVTEGYDGEIVKSPWQLECAALANYPVCSVGQMPKWVDPWKGNNAAGSDQPRGEAPFSELITGTVLDKLRSFLQSASKTSGSSHPSDFDLWCAFLTEAHRQRAKFSGMQLERWLKEVEAWPNETARELGHEYSVARSLLFFYDDERERQIILKNERTF